MYIMDYPKLLTFCLLLLSLLESVIVLCLVVRYFMSIFVLQSSWWGRESWLLCLICLPGVSWWLSGSSSQCYRVVCGLWLWYFLIILFFIVLNQKENPLEYKRLRSFSGYSFEPVTQVKTIPCHTEGTYFLSHRWKQLPVTQVKTIPCHTEGNDSLSHRWRQFPVTQMETIPCHRWKQFPITQVKTIPCHTDWNNSLSQRWKQFSITQVETNLHHREGNHSLSHRLKQFPVTHMETIPYHTGGNNSQKHVISTY